MRNFGVCVNFCKELANTFRQILRDICNHRRSFKKLFSRDKVGEPSGARWELTFIWNSADARWHAMIRLYYLPFLLVTVTSRGLRSRQCLVSRAKGITTEFMTLLLGGFIRVPISQALFFHLKFLRLVSWEASPDLPKNLLSRQEHLETWISIRASKIQTNSKYPWQPETTAETLDKTLFSKIPGPPHSLWQANEPLRH